MDRALLLFCLLGIGSLVQAQTIPSINPDEARLARCFEMLRSNPKQSVEIALEMLDRPALSPRVETRAQACLAFSRQLLGDHAGTAEAVDRVLAIADSGNLDETERLQAIVSISPLLQFLGRVTEALERLTEAQTLAIQLDDRSSQTIALFGIGNVHAIELGNNERALEYFQQVRDLAPPGTRLQLDGAYAHAYTLMLMGRHQQARPELERLLSDANRQAHGITVLRVRSHLAEVQRLDGDIAGASAVFETLHAEQHAVGDSAGEAITRLRLARVHLQTGELDRARTHAEAALLLMESGRFEMETMEALLLLAEVHEAAGAPAAALPLLRREREMAAARTQRQNMAQLAVLQDSIDDITSAHRSERQRIELGQANRRRDLALVALAMVILLVGVVGVHQRRTHTRLRHLSATDPLTGLLNRREMLRRLAALPAPADGQRMLLLLIDVDHFKSINTRHGHAEGDTVLAAISTWLTEACDAGDLVARWGGEEFLVARPATDLDGAARFAEHVRAGVRDGSVVLDDGQRVSVTVSIGAAPVPFFPGDPPHLPAGIRIADSALRAVKGSGRDGWAVLWGHAAGVSDATLASVEHDPMRAADNGWLRIQSSRPLQWPARALAAAALGDAAPE
ncbi:tetratricopeptide repeat-containing diguanylate cyclase [Luteimonas terrae]|uniref:diguanylate cyclase n=1 Tax=Luteimonas terrae TaxID=1530191 RepID=A0ABU1XYA8_9GAMM|nr:diguanylate cyclase [Luteimonas terrae]MDR7193588.1 diguanylate cyclase (GGDEF)-like protein [Luteimonas terrae]